MISYLKESVENFFQIFSGENWIHQLRKQKLSLKEIGVTRDFLRKQMFYGIVFIGLWLALSILQFFDPWSSVESHVFLLTFFGVKIFFLISGVVLFGDALRALYYLRYQMCVPRVLTCRDDIKKEFGLDFGLPKFRQFLFHKSIPKFEDEIFKDLEKFLREQKVVSKFERKVRDMFEDSVIEKGEPRSKEE